MGRFILNGRIAKRLLLLSLAKARRAQIAIWSEQSSTTGLYFDFRRVFFPFLGSPSAGAKFLPEEDRPNGPPVVMVFTDCGVATTAGISAHPGTTD